MRRALTLALVAGMLAAVASGQETQTKPRVRIDTSKGPIVIELEPDKAPKTVANFLEYIRTGHYYGTIFHRVIPGFMIQGGGVTQEFQGKPLREPIPNEADNGLKNKRGTVAMARTGDPHSATAQFFINVVDNPFLDFKAKTAEGWGYTVFGKVVEGMDVADAIAKVPTGAGGPFPKDVPKQPIVIMGAKRLDQPK